IHALRRRGVLESDPVPQGAEAVAAGAASAFQMSRWICHPSLVRCQTSTYLPVTVPPFESWELQTPERQAQSPPTSVASDLILTGMPAAAMSFAQKSRIAARPLTTGAPGGSS